VHRKGEGVQGDARRKPMAAAIGGLERCCACVLSAGRGRGAELG